MRRIPIKSKYLVILLSALLGFLNSSCESRGNYTSAEKEFRNKFRLTYYWTVFPEDSDLSSPLIPIVDLKNRQLAKVPVDLVKKISLEGSGYIPDGRLINLACPCKYPHSKFFVLDNKKFPYGVDSRGKALKPFRSIAVDPKVLPIGSVVYIKEFDGLQLPLLNYHDGCFQVADTGYTVHGQHIDVFSGKFQYYKTVNKVLNNKNKVTLILNHKKCLYLAKN